MHEHQYDESGRLVRTIVHREAWWTPDDRAWMLGLAAREAAECRRCGGDLHETTDPAHSPDDKAGAAHYVAAAPVECFRCREMAVSQEAWAKDHRAAALIHMVELVPRRRRRPDGVQDDRGSAPDGAGSIPQGH